LGVSVCVIGLGLGVSVCVIGSGLGLLLVVRKREGLTLTLMLIGRDFSPCKGFSSSGGNPHNHFSNLNLNTNPNDNPITITIGTRQAS